MPALVLALVLALVVATILTACGDEGGRAPAGKIVVSEAWVTPTLVAGHPAAAYMKLENMSSHDDSLTNVSSPLAARSVLHQSLLIDDRMTMKAIDSLPLPGGESVTLAPGGYHIMLFGLERDLDVGDRVELRLEFAGAPANSIAAPVEARAPHMPQDH